MHTKLKQLHRDNFFAPSPSVHPNTDELDELYKKVIEAYDHLQINNIVMKRGVVESIRSCLESEVEVKYDKYKKSL